MNIREAISEHFTNRQIILNKLMIDRMTKKFFLPDGTQVFPKVGEFMYLVGITDPDPIRTDPIDPSFTMVSIRATTILDSMIETLDKFYTVQEPVTSLCPILIPRGDVKQCSLPLDA